MIVMKEVKKREMVKGTLPVNSLSRGITPIVASVLQSKAQHLIFVTKGLFTCFVKLTIMMELLVTVLRGLGGASSIFFPLCTQLIWKGNTFYGLADITLVVVMSVDDWICIDE